MRGLWVFGLACSLFAMACEPALEAPTFNSCFDENVRPLVERDCAFCHYHGEYGVTLRGLSSDYAELLRYSEPYDSAHSPLLDWASGGMMHPVLWSKDGPEYRTLALWIDHGMKRECFDMQYFGECRFDADCFQVGCLCPDMDFVSGRVCVKDPATRKGMCAIGRNCADPRFGFCRSGEQDGGLDGGLDAGSDAGIDAGLDAGQDEDAGTDAGADEGPLVSFSTNIVPLLSSDCRRCHSAGQYGIRLLGTGSDYSEVMRYVDIDDPEGYDSFLWWSAGGAAHPNSWPKGGSRYNLFLEWVLQGALNN